MKNWNETNDAYSNNLLDFINGYFLYVFDVGYKIDVTVLLFNIDMDWRNSKKLLPQYCLYYSLVSFMSYKAITEIFKDSFWVS